jgi:glycerophosphoryl diester phosphodiesterase
MNILFKFGSMALLAGCALLGRPAPLFKARSTGQKGIEVYAHRGTRSFAPENTLPAYRAGLRIGTHWVDADLGMTRDGELVVTHDFWLNPDLVRRPDGSFLPRDLQALALATPPGAPNPDLEPYLVKNLTLAELRTYDVGRLNPAAPYASYFPEQLPVDGTPMPTLREVIRYAKRVTAGKVGFQLEMKTHPQHPDWTCSPRQFATALHRLLVEEGILDNVEIQAFDWNCLLELQKLSPAVRTSYLTASDNELQDPQAPAFSDSFYHPDPAKAGLWTAGRLLKDFQGSVPRMIKAMGGTIWSPEDVELTLEALREAHRLGLKVVTWTWPEHTGTPFDPAVIRRLIDWGVDGIITDDPGRLGSMLAARGFQLPRRYAAR